LIDGRFEKRLTIAGPLGYIYTVFGLEVSLAGLPGPNGRAQAR
jgi:hypothetical protein